jgi:hypothetical protein
MDALETRRERKKETKEGGGNHRHARLSELPRWPLVSGTYQNSYNRRVSFPVITNGQVLGGTVKFRKGP